MRKVISAQMLIDGLSRAVYVEVVLFERREIRYGEEEENFYRTEEVKVFNVWGDFRLEEDLQIFSPNEVKGMIAHCRGQLFKLGKNNTPPIFFWILKRLEAISRGTVSVDEERMLSKIFGNYMPDLKGL